ATMLSVPATASGSRVVNRKRETLAMLGKASPRNPSVAIAARSFAVRILLVACRSKESNASSRSIPQPSSTTRMSEMPPRRMLTSILRAPASILFSTSSLTTDAGRSMTSPAATWLARFSGLQYEMSLDAKKPGDETIERDGVEFFVDAESADYLRGSTLDYRDGLTGAGFHIENPNAARTCGCGTSFEAARPA